MESTPSLKKVDALVGCKARWSFDGFRCRLAADAKGVTVNMKKENTALGEPGEEFTFHKACRSVSESMAFVETLPSTFGEEDAERLGFARTGWTLYD